MRIAIASYGQETSSFSQLPTTLQTFELYGLYEGEEILQKCREVGAIGGFMAAADESQLEWTPVPIIHGWAGAHGPLTAETLAHFERAVCDGLKSAGDLDAMYFALHGAAASESVHDTEGHLLSAVRAIVGPDFPVVISLDHHANLTQSMVEKVNGLVAHRAQPHDQFETGMLAGRMLISMLRKETRPVVAWRNIPLITHQEQFLTAAGPMKAWFDLAREMEGRPGVIAASPFPMQPWLDVPEGGWSVAVVTDDDTALAGQLAAELANDAWARREDFCRLDSISPEMAVRNAVEAENGLIVLTDTGDSVFGGATGDSTWCPGRDVEAVHRADRPGSHGRSRNRTRRRQCRGRGTYPGDCRRQARSHLRSPSGNRGESGRHWRWPLRNLSARVRVIRYGSCRAARGRRREVARERETGHWRQPPRRL